MVRRSLAGWRDGLLGLLDRLDPDGDGPIAGRRVAGATIADDASGVTRVALALALLSDDRPPGGKLVMSFGWSAGAERHPPLFSWRLGARLPHNRIIGTTRPVGRDAADFAALCRTVPWRAATRAEKNELHLLTSSIPPSSRGWMAAPCGTGEATVEAEAPPVRGSSVLGAVRRLGDRPAREAAAAVVAAWRSTIDGDACAA